MKKFGMVAALALTVAPMMASAQNAADPDKNVAGGVLVKGWVGRTDRANTPITGA